MTSFGAAVMALGALLIAGALVSGIARRSVLSLTALFVLAGFAIGPGGFDLVRFDAHSGFVSDLAFVALIVILFRDGLEVDGELLQHAWHLPLRKLVVAMPVTACCVALAARVLVGLSWTEAFLVGALLSPTDPVLSSSIVTDARVPRLVRHSLNLESGLNDGLALPAVLAFAAALRSDTHDFVWWRFVLEDVGLGFAYGIACGLIASLLMPRPRLERKDGDIPAHQKALYGLGVAFATYGATVLSPRGNGLIAVFVCAIVLGLRRPDLRAAFERGSAEIIEVVKLGVFVVFGSLLTLHGLFHDSWGAIGLVAVALFVARPLAVGVALAGTATDRGTRIFMGWFGPKGVATMTFALLVLSEPISGAGRIFDLAALAVMCSIILHGTTERAGVRWIAARARDRA